MTRKTEATRFCHFALAHDRIILNPHTAFCSEEGLLDMRLKGSEASRRVLLGQPPRNGVN